MLFEPSCFETRKRGSGHSQPSSGQTVKICKGVKRSSALIHYSMKDVSDKIVSTRAASLPPGRFAQSNMCAGGLVCCDCATPEPICEEPAVCKQQCSD